MKFKFLISLILFVFCFGFVKAQSNNTSYTIVIEVPSFSEDKFIDVCKSSLNSMDGVKLQSYCSSQGWLVLSINDSIIPASSDPEVILRNSGVKGIIKYGATADQVEANCHGEMKYLTKRVHQ